MTGVACEKKDLFDLEAKIERIRYSIKSIESRLNMFWFVILISSSIIAFSVAIAVHMLTSNTYEDGYVDGYRQGVMDALGDPDSALANLLCTGGHNATVVIDGKTFQLTCETGG